MMTLAAANKAEREKWLDEHWPCDSDVNGVPKRVAALTLQAFGYIPGVPQEGIDSRNKELRNRIFAERFGGRLSCEGIEIPNGALILQRMRVIPSV
ncbi:hypothetical protein KZZ52_32880 [Dactylosporangium sp. AC04546]|uniref:hypothetical protein n=1 Tax=Dactylosporangium sp. AC04546 TaxID=2862460 RepID=UPI001EDF8914|nr:hypothetical protein [Dactylosporangium sp. AC04546]WVK78786.1 hypothetical protein KZZ52_32880 [Dactylosporangium sp. AC04546]